MNTYVTPFLGFATHASRVRRARKSIRVLRDMARDNVLAGRIGKGDADKAIGFSMRRAYRVLSK